MPGVVPHPLDELRLQVEEAGLDGGAISKLEGFVQNTGQGQIPPNFLEYLTVLPGANPRLLDLRTQLVQAGLDSAALSQIEGFVQKTGQTPPIFQEYLNLLNEGANPRPLDDW